MRTGAGSLRDRLTINRPSKVSNGRGGQVDSVTVIASAIPACVVAKRGGEEVQARRLTGVTPYEITMRYNATTSAITSSDFLTDRHGNTYAVKWVGSLDEARKRWVLIEAETGTVTTR